MAHMRPPSVARRPSRTAPARWRFVAVSGLFFGSLGSAFPVAAQQPQRYSLRGNDAAVYNLVGAIRVEGANAGEDIRVEVATSGPDANRLRVESGPIRGRETLRVIYPDDRIVFRPDRRWGRSRFQLHVNDDGTFSGDGWSRGRDRVEIVSSGSGLEAQAEVRVVLPKGKRISVHLAAGEVTIRNVDGDVSADVHAATLTSTGTRGALNLETGSGEVSVTDAQGEVNIDSGSGEVTISGVKGTSLTIDSGSGEITATNVVVERLELDTGSGGLELRQVSAPEVTLDTGSGSVDVELTSDVSSMRIDTGSGRVTLRVPESLGAELDASTGSGGIDFDFPVTVTRHGRNHMRAKLGDGRGRIEVDTGSGSVRILRSRA